MAFEEANDAIASERRISSENQDYKSFVSVTVNPYVRTHISDSRCTGWGSKKLIAQTHTQDNYSNFHCTCATRVNDMMY